MLELVTLARSLPCFTQSLRDNIYWLLLALSTDQWLDLFFLSYSFAFIIIIFIIIIIIIIVISFIQGIYIYIPETNYVPREYNVAAILLLLFMVLISLVSVLNLLYFYISTFRSVCAVPNMAVFCSSLTSFSRYVAHVFSKCLWNSPSRPYYYWYHLCVYIPHALYVYCKVFIF